MEENVALDSKKQRKFVKSIRGIKKLIKKKEGKAEPQKKDEKVVTKKPFSMKLKGGKVNKKKYRKERGLVYLSHIPHGFYEHQMTEYFKQFGVVTNARVIRSKRTGNSKGFAFVEFKEPAVGQIVAETMDNYLMGKRLIKAAYIPPEKQRRNAFRKNWNSVNNPTSQIRMKTKKEFNTDRDEIGDLKRAKKLLTNLNKNKKKLSEIGVNYDFAPVDVPEALLSSVIKKEKGDDKSVEEDSKPKKVETRKEDKNVLKKEAAQNGQKTNEIKGKKEKKNKNKKDNKPVEVTNKEQPVVVTKKVKQAEVTKKGKPVEVTKTQQSVEVTKKEKRAVATKTEKPAEVTKKQKSVEVIKKGKPTETKKENVPTVNKKGKLPEKVNKKQQKEKNLKLKNAGVKPAEFIKVGDSDDSDSAYEFDSDEYDKMLEKMSENSELSILSDQDDESGDDREASDDDEDSDEEEPPPRKSRIKPALKIVPVLTKKQAQMQQPQAKKQDQKKPVEAKRKAPQKQAVSPKKAKFEKQVQKPMKKHFKKK